MSVRHSYRRTATMTYDVTDVATGRLVGTMRRTRDGWSYTTADGREGASYGVSRPVAASALRALADEQREG